MNYQSYICHKYTSFMWTSGSWSMNWETMKILYPNGHSINEEDPEIISVINKWQPFIFQNVKSLCILIAKNCLNSLPLPDPWPFQHFFGPTPMKRWCLFLHPLNPKLPCDLLQPIEYARNYIILNMPHIPLSETDY